MKDHWIKYREVTIGYSLVSTIIYFVLLQMLSLLLLSTLFMSNTLTLEEFFWIEGFIYLISSLIFFFIVFGFLRRRLDNFFFTKTEFKFYLIAVGFALFVVFIQPNFWNRDVAVFHYYALPRAIKSVIFVPIIEELFFRGFLLGEMKKRYSTLVSLLVSSVLFSLIHLPNIEQSLFALIGGSFSAILFIISKSIYPSLVFHITWNFIVQLAYYFSL